jgi:hypothetical protein
MRDASWILSGLPLGLLCIAASHWISPSVIMFLGFGILGTAHLISPIGLAWAHPEMRQVALS